MEISLCQVKFENDRLEKVLHIIEEQLIKAGCDKQRAFNEAMELRKSFWDSQPTIPENKSDLNTIVGITQNLHSIKREERREEASNIALRKLNKLKKSPYFARIDFQEDSSIHSDNIYIGISTLIDDDCDMVVYDWRAPLCSLFYENETGPAAYSCPDGIINGEITLKRQFSIANGKIQYMFNSSLKIDDDMLQKILSRNSDEKMRTIISTIQKEQNKAIRDEDNALLIVQGPAGSGKTSIALHRAAYILYKYRKRGITAENIVIFSPNDIFNDYISEVLPELGENNIYQTTFIDYAKNSFQGNMHIEDSADQMEYILSAPKDDDYYIRRANIAFKTSLNFAEIIKRYISYIEREGIRFSDIKFREWTVIKAEELRSLFYNTYGKWPALQRFNEMSEDINDILKNIEQERIKQVEAELKENDDFDDIKAISRLKVMKEFKNLRDQIKNMLSIDALEVYKKILGSKELLKEVSEGIDLPANIEDILVQSLAFLQRGMIKYEDIAPLLYIKYALGGSKDMSHIKYVIIDEAQDYSPFQYHIFKQIFPRSGFTILGDISQAINPYANTLDGSIIKNIFSEESSSSINLSKSYRSTKEISDFTKEIIQKPELISVDRCGEKPEVIEAEDEKDRLRKILSDVKNMKVNGIESIGIICRTAFKAANAYKNISQYNTEGFEMNLIKKDDIKFKPGISVIPSYLAKGLEFDAVIVFDGEDAEYHDESERKLFYTICTRALHTLHIYYKEKPSAFISGIGNDLYVATVS